VIAGFDPARLGAALGASILAHMLLLSAFGQLPGTRQAAPFAQLGERALRATLRPLAPEPAPAPAKAPAQAILPGAKALPAPAASLPTGSPPAHREAQEPTAAVIPVVPLPKYYAAHELDQRPLPLTHIEPAFPAGAPVHSGVVKLRLYVSADGQVEEIDIFESQPAGVFEAAAAQAFAGARFSPGIRGGKPVPAMMTFELQFGAPQDADPRVARSAEGERARPENPNAADAPDRAAVRKRPARAAGGG
jgi:TonB family protein